MDRRAPFASAYIWSWFWDLHGRRGAGGMSINPIGWEAIFAWSRLKRISLAPWEADALAALDDAFLSSHAEQMKSKSSTETANG